MTIIAIGGEKGGVGKTCLAINIAAWLAQTSTNVGLLDTDSKPNALCWLGERPMDRPRIHGACETHRVRLDWLKRFEHVVIDAGAGDTEVLRTAMELADVLISPFRPAQFDVWKAEHVARRITEARERNKKLRAFAVVNAAPTRADRLDEGEQAHAALRSFRVWRVAPIIRDLKAFVATQGLGLGVYEHGRRGKEARGDLDALLSAVGLQVAA